MLCAVGQPTAARPSAENGYLSSDAASQPDLLLVNIDALGDTMLTRTYGKNLWAGTGSNSAQQAARGGYIIAGEASFEPDDFLAELKSPVSTTPPELALYPNPAFEQVRLQLPAALHAKPLTLSLHDRQGRIVRQWRLSAAPAAMPLDVRGLARGGYLLRVTGSRLINDLKLSRRVLLD